MEIIFSIIGTITGLFGVFFGLLSINRSKIETINEFYKIDRDQNFIEARKTMHLLKCNYEPKSLMEKHGDKIAFLILAYDQSGLLVKKRHLPFWVFSKGACGATAVKFYNILKPYIDYKRGENKYYAINYEYLVKKIEKKR